MDKYYLRVEAVNFNYFIYDTDKIQPMRGGSYLLLESINNLAGQTINGIMLNKIMTGASIGLFTFELKDGVNAEDIAAEVRRNLYNQTGGHATFVVDVLKSTGKFEQDNETITAMNRWQQFQKPTLILPEEKDADDKCFYDGVRPGVERESTPEGQINVSSSVKFRTEKGRELRQNIYKRILGDKDFKADFTSDLDELTDSQSKENLNHKMAFIYFDGNKFSKIRAEKCKMGTTLTAFSDCVEKHRRDFLSKLIDKAKNDSDFQNKGKIRLETLLWGGDEFEIVVPAWKGWEVLRLFYDCISKATFDSINLTHGGGVIFCNHKAPIRQIRDIARKLADMAKGKLPSDFEMLKHDENDIAHYLIMESFDTVGPDVKHFVKQYYGDGCYDDFTLTPKKIGDITDALTIMKKNGFPHNKMFEIIRIIKIGPCIDQKERIASVFKKSLSEVDKPNEVCAAIEKVIEDNYHRWLMLADLVDYVGG